MAPMKAPSVSRASEHNSPAIDAAIRERRNSSFKTLAWALSCMCSSNTRLSAMLRMPLNPTSPTARETVLMLPPRE